MNTRKKILIAKLKAQIRLREIKEKRNGNYQGRSDQELQTDQLGNKNNNNQEGDSIPNVVI